MAVFKVVSPRGHYKNETTYRDVVDYVTSPTKARHGYVALGGGLSMPESAAGEMEKLAQDYGKTKGTRIRHSILRFHSSEEINSFDAHEIASELIKYYEGDYQILATVHEDTPELHIHMLMNTVRKWDGRKYEGKKDDYYRFIKHMKSALRPYGVKIKESRG